MAFLLPMPRGMNGLSQGNVRRGDVTIPLLMQLQTAPPLLYIHIFTHHQHRFYRPQQLLTVAILVNTTPVGHRIQTGDRICRP
jgi:hypothetical protein